MKNSLEMNNRYLKINATSELIDHPSLWYRHWEYSSYICLIVGDIPEFVSITDIQPVPELACAFCDRHSINDNEVQKFILSKGIVADSRSVFFQTEVEIVEFKLAFPDSKIIWFNEFKPSRNKNEIFASFPELFIVWLSDFKLVE